MIGVMADGGQRSPGAEDRYRDTMVSIVRGVLALGYDARLVVGDDADAGMAESIRNEVGSPRVECRVPVSLNDLSAVFADAAAVVATRFHNVLMSIRIGKPTIGIAYAPKTRDLMASVGLENDCLEVADLSSTSVLHLLEGALDGGSRPDRAAARGPRDRGRDGTGRTTRTGRWTVMNPAVSVGIPVFNGEKYLPATLRSVQEQTLSDIEILIADNGSTDGTEQICRDAAASDPRVRYLRSETNNGGVPGT